MKDLKPERKEDLVESEGEVLRKQRLTWERLNPDEILVTEFEYIAQTAFQADEDRARITTFYLTSLSSLVAAILSVQLEKLQEPSTYWAFSALLILLSLAGALTVLQLARLRQAWFDSILAMNQIKEFYMQHLQEMNLGEAFRWRLTTIPPKFKPWSISFMLAVQVALLGGTTLGAAIIFAGLSFQAWWWGYAISAGAIYFALQLILYQRILRS
jgi:hypothetical protein